MSLLIENGRALLADGTIQATPLLIEQGHIAAIGA